MARYKKDHSEKTRQQLISEASKLLRLNGFEGVSVAEVMKAAGLTHGGFYAHFKDKNDLLVEALREALKESPENFRFLGDMVKQKQSIAPVALGYLSPHRVNNRAEGCSAAALSSDITRQNEEIKAVFEEGLNETVTVLKDILDKPAWAEFSMLYGALALMRIVESQEKQDLIRQDVLKTLQALSHKP
jgi:TetR/AcrR family transcriptional regulator, transcriptional repressor for nem operon